MPRESSRSSSDEDYVLGLCDDILGLSSRRQHKFDFLLGDARPGGTPRQLPVDAFYPPLRLVIEYRERQHTEPVAFFDKPDRMTVSGIPRGEQRAKYDERRRTLLPANGISLVEVSYRDLGHRSNGRLSRDRAGDMRVLTEMLKPWVPAE